MPKLPKLRPTKLLRRIIPALITFVLTAQLTQRARIPRQLILPTSTLAAVMSTFFTRGRRAKAKPPSVDWLDAIQAIGNIVDKFSQGLAGPSPNIFLDASLQRLLHSHHSTQSKQTARQCPRTEDDLLLTARTFLDFALAPYGFLLLKISGVIEPRYNIFFEGARGIDVAKYMLRLNDADVIRHHLGGEKINFPRYFVALHHETSSIVIAIRGTNSVSDVITDLLCGNTTFHDGYAHSGMLTAASQILGDCNELLRKSVVDTGYRVIVTGHSLGAGVGVLLTKMLLMDNIKTECFAFAPPPVFGPKEAIDNKWSNAVRAFVNDDDLVSRLSFASAKHLAREMDALASVGTGKVKRLLVGSGDAVKVRDAVKELPRVESATGFEALFQTARAVHWLLPSDEGVNGDFDDLPPAYVPEKRYDCFNVPSELFEEILVTAPCVGRHMVSGYTGAFAGLRLPKRERFPAPEREDSGRVWFRWGYSQELG